ncbi:methyl-accepting chemotaxis protein [Metapseudomonas lalkuanensis]|uniref:Methyl-accepting chemotaxis protein n=1 Tax=Metapseudomonas lalkuanensis TaxID=2604832 RepID=A0A5J6QP72_9GAMM|nr:methyl-accepting chemotaxis protein [Pseudomonas lalkuanensis]QEY64253.1 methyl-accepting chemotaxis protein [Pseudomonas lalkuanensis]
MYLSKLSIKTKITVLAGLCMLAVLAVLVAVSIFRIQGISQAIDQSSSAALQGQALQHLYKVGEAEAQAIAKRFSEGAIFGETLARQILFMKKQAQSRGGDPAELRKDIFNMMQEQVAASPGVLGVGVAFEPNLLDGQDDRFVGLGVGAGNDTGRFASYATTQLKSYAMPENEMADDGQASTYWYRCARDSKRLCVINPYTYTTLQGIDVLMSTISIPLVEDGRVVAVMSIDLALSSLQEVVQASSNSLYGGRVQMSFISSDGAVAARSGDKESLGKSLTATVPKLAGEVHNRSQAEAVSHVELDGEITVVAPFSPLVGTPHWSVVIQVPTSVLMAQVGAMRKILDEANNAATRTQLIVGVVGAMIGLVLIWFMAASIARPILNVAEMLKDIASGEGDLTKRLVHDGRDEIGQMAGWFNRFLDKLQPIISEVSESVDNTRRTADQAATIASETNGGMQQQFREIEQVATAAQEMSATSQDVARNAAMAADAARHVDEAVREGTQTIERTTHSINKLASEMNLAMLEVGQLAESSEQIGKVLVVIRSVAEQTNLLALNAAIEAARAGESGRGFAVVADEVRHLAKRTQDSVEEIQGVIQNLQHGTRNVVLTIQANHAQADASVQQVDQAVQALQKISKAIEVIGEMNLQIASAAEEQSAVSEEVNRNVSAIRDVTELLATQSKDSAQISQSLTDLANQQQRLMGSFRV